MFSSVEFSHSVMSNSLWPHESQHTRPPCPSPTSGVTQNHVHQVCDAIQPTHPLSSPSPPVPNPSQHQGLFQRVNSLHEVAKVLEFQLQHQSFQRTPRTVLLQDGLVGSPCSPRVFSNIIVGSHSWISGWISLAVKSLLQHHSSKGSIFQHSAFFTVKLSHLYMTTGKTIALTRWTFVGKVMSLLFNTLSMLVITFLPRNKCLLISWLRSPSAVLLETLKIKSDTASTVSPSICHEVMWPDAMILVFWVMSFKSTFSLPLSLSSRGFLVPLHFLP